jgi:hypothetical protein
MTEKYQHGEAFCLMFYACPCGHRERMWNSRDGVTPFGGITCPSCGLGFGTPALPGRPSWGLSHVQFAADYPVPDHKPWPGQRFWRDGTPAEAVEIIERRIVKFAEAGRAIPEDIAEKLRNDAFSQAPDSEWRKGWPYLDQAPLR